jgi:DNA-binding NarL/FixJ family response regulator
MTTRGTIVDKLYPNEIAAVDALVENFGPQNKKLAEILGLSIDTVKHRIHYAMVKTGTFTRVELALRWTDPAWQAWLREMGIR